MSPPANATGGDTKPLAARIKPTKKRFLDTYTVCRQQSCLSKQNGSWDIRRSYRLRHPPFAAVQPYRPVLPPDACRHAQK